MRNWNTLQVYWKQTMLRIGKRGHEARGTNIAEPNKKSQHLTLKKRVSLEIDVFLGITIFFMESWHIGSEETSTFE